jgi:hypothetical protein
MILSFVFRCALRRGWRSGPKGFGLQTPKCSLTANVKWFVCTPETLRAGDTLSPERQGVTSAGVNRPETKPKRKMVLSALQSNGAESIIVSDNEYYVNFSASMAVLDWKPRPL